MGTLSLTFETKTVETLRTTMFTEDNLHSFYDFEDNRKSGDLLILRDTVESIKRSRFEGVRRYEVRQVFSVAESCIAIENETYYNFIVNSDGVFLGGDMAYIKANLASLKEAFYKFCQHPATLASLKEVYYKFCQHPAALAISIA